MMEINSQNNRFIVLDSLPAYDVMYVPITPYKVNTYSEGLVIRFFKNDGTNWIANVHLGGKSFNHVRAFKKCNLLLIIAGGRCYLINPDDEYVYDSLDYVGFNSLIENPLGGFILEDSLGIMIFDEMGNHSYEYSISYGGFKNLTIQNNVLCGYALDLNSSYNQDYYFSLNLKSRKLKGGVPKSSGNSVTSWWRFW